MVSRRAMAILGGTGLGLLALIGVATAKPKGNGGGTGPAPSDSDHEAQCDASRAELAIARNQVAYLDGVIYELDAARMAAAQNEDEQSYQSLTQTQNEAKIARTKFRNRITQLETFLESCE